LALHRGTAILYLFFLFDPDQTLSTGADRLAPIYPTARIPPLMGQNKSTPSLSKIRKEEKQFECLFFGVIIKISNRFFDANLSDPNV
jgi:hypothetical protein